MISSTQLELQAVRMLAMGPAFAVMLVGVILAIRRLPVHPRPCWAILASLALTAFKILGLPVIVMFAMEATGGFRSTTDLKLRTLFFTLPYSLVEAVSWGLILFAVFDRPASPKFLADDDLDRGP